MNKCLLLSSLICGILILKNIYLKYNPDCDILYKFVIIGIITSILNHGTTNKMFKYLDRLVITLTITYILYYYYISRKMINFKLILAISCYLSSKMYDNLIIRNSLHLSSHVLSLSILNDI